MVQRRCKLKVKGLKAIRTTEVLKQQRILKAGGTIEDVTPSKSKSSGKSGGKERDKKCMGKYITSGKGNKLGKGVLV